MSRRLPSTHHHHFRQPPSTTNDNPYQPTTVPAHACTHRSTHRNGHTVIDTGLTDETLSDSQIYYDYYHGNFSDESGSTRLPFDEESCRRVSRNTYSSDRSYGRKTRDRDKNPAVHKDIRRVYPQQTLYQEIPQTQASEVPPPNRRAPVERPQSAMSSGVTSAIVDGCGGKCQTFENVCYFFLQLVFMMGILIGVSLCIAGLVLRKSAARNLQVLVYIGIMLGIVSGVLLGIQWNARHLAKKRKLAVRNAKRAPIPLETLYPRSQQAVQQPLVALQEGPRVQQVLVDQQGIPWWRRKDLI